MQGLFLVLLGIATWRLHIPAALVGRGLRGGVTLLLFVALANLLWWLVARHFEWAAGTTLLHPAGFVLLLLRLVNLLVLGGLLSASTPPADAAAAVEALLHPLGRWHAPLRELGLIVGLAIGFVPLLRQEAQRLAAVQRVRRGKRSWSWPDRVRVAAPFLVPLFVGVLRRADEVALALEARAFEPRSGRSSYVGAHCGPAELLAVGLGGLLLILGIRY